VIKVGTSTLTQGGGVLNHGRIEELCKVVSAVKQSGKDVVLVTSGAIGAGVARLGLPGRPAEVKEKQAAAAVGQSLLMAVYDKFFAECKQIAGQVLLTKDIVTDQKKRENAVNTFGALFHFGVIPVVNENDTISTEEIVFGDNDTLSACVANIVQADLLLLLTDVDGLYDRDPGAPGAKIIPEVNKITEAMKAAAGGAGTARGIGGMVTKLMAAEIAAQSKTKTVILSGARPALIYDVLAGKPVGTYFNL
jgi:glutamate 5-kinase